MFFYSKPNVFIYFDYFLLIYFEVKFDHIWRAENRSMFRDMRILKERYLLTTMLGKGGFSEVTHNFINGDFFKHKK